MRSSKSRQQGGVYEDQNNPNCQPAGISGSVCVNHLWPVVAGGGGMTKDEALDLALEALEAADWYINQLEIILYSADDAGTHEDRLKVQQAITAIKQACALDKKAENTMIYRTFEQWKSGNVLEHGVPRTEHYSEDQLDLVEMGWNYGYDAGRAVEQALDKKAENARELGLDYEPVGWWDSKIGFFEEKHFDQLQPLYTTPPAAAVLEGRDWSLLEATQESLREHIAEIKRLKAAQPSVPDAIIEAGESPDYRDGWNDCRQTMLEMMK
jgi:hypothetical protein